MTSQSITPTPSRGSTELAIATIVGIAWALSYLSWLVALPLWIVGVVGFLYSHPSLKPKEWAGVILGCLGAPLTAFVVYRWLAPIA